MLREVRKLYAHAHTSELRLYRPRRFIVCGGTGVYHIGLADVLLFPSYQNSIPGTDYRNGFMYCIDDANMQIAF